MSTFICNQVFIYIQLLFQCLIYVEFRYFRQVSINFVLNELLNIKTDLPDLVITISVPKP